MCWRQMFVRLVCIGVTFVTLAAHAADPANLLPDVTNRQRWLLMNPADAADCRLMSTDTMVRVDVIRAKNEPARSDVSLGCMGVSGKAGKAYNLRFTARASEPRQITISAFEPSKRDESIMGQAATELKTTWQTYVCRIVLTRDCTPSTRLPSFAFGDKAGSIWFRDVTLVPAEEATPKPTGDAPAKAASDTPAKSAGDAPQSLIADMDYPDAWLLKQRGGAKGSVRREGESLRVDVTAVTSEAWHLLLLHAGSEVPAGRSYVLNFSARASVPTKILLSAQRGEEPYDDLVPSNSMSVATQWQEYSWKFALTKPCTPRDVLPIIQLGATTGTIWFRNMSLVADRGDSR